MLGLWKAAGVLALAINTAGIAITIDRDVGTWSPDDVKNKISKIIVLIEKTTAQTDGRTTNLNQDEKIIYTRTVGTLIAPRWVLSYARDSRDMVGAWVSADGGRYLVESVLVSPKFSEDNLDFDQGNIALLRLRDPVVGFSDFPTLGIIDEPFSHDLCLIGSVETTPVQIMFTENGISSVPRIAIGEITPLATHIGVPEIDGLFATDCRMSLHCSLRDISHQNFHVMSWDFGAGLFSLEGALIGLLTRSASTSCSHILFEHFEGPVNFEFAAYATFDEETLEWIRETLTNERAVDIATLGPSLFTFLLSAKRPESGLAQVPPEIIRRIASLVAPTLYSNH